MDPICQSGICRIYTWTQVQSTINLELFEDESILLNVIEMTTFSLHVYQFDTIKYCYKISDIFKLFFRC